MMGAVAQRTGSMVDMAPRRGLKEGLGERRRWAGAGVSWKQGRNCFKPQGDTTSSPAVVNTQDT